MLISRPRILVLSFEMVPLAILLPLLAHLMVPCKSQQPGFLSLSCGATSNFTDGSTGIAWEPDTKYILSRGSTSRIQGGGGSSSGSSNQAVRYFPLISSTRNLNCYDISVAPGLYLTRATFSYGNYDNLQQPPRFQFVMNQTVITTIDLSSSDPWVEEVVWSGSSAAFCLLAVSNAGVPVISSLEVRPLSSNMYQEAGGLMSGKVILQKLHRIDCGENSKTIRYPNDVQDRIWDRDNSFSPQGSTTVSSFNGSINTSATAAPLSVLQTSRVASGSSLSYILNIPGASGDQSFFLVAYFATLTNTTTQASLDILLNGAVKKQGLTLPGSFIATSSTFTGNSNSSSRLNVTLSSQTASAAPEINGLEVFRIINFVPPTTVTDAVSLTTIMSTYSLQLPWDHDPCLPVPWNEIKCSATQGPQVTSLDLSNRGLKGTLLPTLGDLSELTYLNLSRNQLSRIPQELWSLSQLETLDLSFNQLFGTLPSPSIDRIAPPDSLKFLDLQNNSLSGGLDFLKDLQTIESVNIMNNNFTGEVPASLVGKIQTSGNPCIGSTFSNCFQAAPSPARSPETSIQLNNLTKSKNQTGKVVGIAIGSAVGAILLLGALIFAMRNKWRSGMMITRRIRSDVKDWGNCKEFSYKELTIATNGFRNELGKGSFGPVYLGRLANGQQVAIKVRSDASQLGADAFANEVSLLSRVRHQNLVELVGFCQSSKKQLLVYEYMAGGTLMDHLYGSKSPLDWKTRLRIAVGAATGLDYLHNGSDSKIIHRDVKSTNILLDSSLNAKVADFGLSKHMTSMDATHVTTMVKGTAGYLDPEYYASNQLTEKSDVYSFGVVLLEMICGREPLSDNVPADQYSIVAWARPYLQTGAYDDVVDRNIHGRYGIGSMAIVANVAAKSTSRNPDQRPKMSEVLRDLKEALAFETAS